MAESTHRPEQAKDYIYCDIVGVNHTQLMQLMGCTPGYAISSVNDVLNTQLLAAKTLESESDFQEEHANLAACTRKVSKTATIVTRYYPAGESLPKFQAES